MVETNLLSLSYGRVIRKAINVIGGLRPESYETYNIVEEGDVVLRMTDLQNDKKSIRVGQALERGLITSAYITVRPDTTKADPRFIAAVLRAYDIQKAYYEMGAGVRQNLGYAELIDLPIPMPSLEIQKRIADYLDRETGEIDAMVAKLDELTKTLEIRRTTVIASIAGINRAKETRPLQWLATLTTGSTPSGGSGEENFATEGAVGWVTPEDLHSTLALTRFPTAAALDQLTVVPSHSTLVCGIGSVGKLGFAETPVTTNQQVTAAIPRDGVHGRYLYYALAAEKEQLLANTVTTTLPIINNARLGSLTIKLCSPGEQRRIADHLDDVISKIDQMLAKTAELKALLLERRSALITEVVTGRKDPA
ncbi:restriction endonuclease subunit S [Brevibacterium litoralis]|uniref:restriction endonuclease subunit S n=1 Tax=Brevibacterium litoralis TaxID=3138935 RepID=UPI0032EBC374